MIWGSLGSPRSKKHRFSPCWSGSRTRSQARGQLCAYLSLPQDNYNLLHKRINHTWDFVVMQAREQLR